MGPDSDQHQRSDLLPQRPPKPVVYLSLSRGICRACRRMVQVRYISEDDRVYLERHCPTHGISRALVAESLQWYLQVMKETPGAHPPEKTLPKQAACPQACGPCEFHTQACRLPVFSITNACNLHCPICFTYNRPDQPFFMSEEEFRRHIDFVVASTGGVDLVNITGGEPTLHPRLFELLEAAKHPAIGRITLNSNGLTLARDPEMCRRLAEQGVYVVLSLDTLKEDLSRRLHGRDITREKRLAIENLGRFGVQTTLLMVLVGGVNEDELPALVDLTTQNEFVRSLTIQTMTYTGQGGGSFLPRKHIPVDGVERRIEEATAGRIRRRDFLPLPSAHPLCYGVTYLIADGKGSVHSFLDVLDREIVSRHLAEGYLLRPSSELEEELGAAINRIWAEGKYPALLDTLKQMVRRIFPRDEILTTSERQQRAETMVKTIYIHAHMDEDTYEIGRAMRCPDQVPVHAERLIGACNYNLFYRQKDERFWVEKCP